MLVDVVVDHGWAQRNERKKKEMAQEMCPLGQRKENRKTEMPRRQVSPKPIPLSLIISLPPHLLWHGRLCVGPRCGWCWWFPCVPPLFPHHSSSSHPLAIHWLLIPIVVVLVIPTPIAPHSYLTSSYLQWQLGVLWQWPLLWSPPPHCSLFAIPSLLMLSMSLLPSPIPIIVIVGGR